VTWYFSVSIKWLGGVSYLSVTWYFSVSIKWLGVVSCLSVTWYFSVSLKWLGVISCLSVAWYFDCHLICTEIFTLHNNLNVFNTPELVPCRSWLWNMCVTFIIVLMFICIVTVQRVNMIYGRFLAN